MKKQDRNGTERGCANEAEAVAMRDLEELNRLFRKYEAAADKLAEAYRRAFSQMDERLCGVRRCARGASAKFELWRKHMAGSGAKTKFDCVAGEYFLANKGEKEVFAIRVTDTRSCVIRVAAMDVEEAMEIALAEAKRCPRRMTGDGPVAEDMSRD